MACKNCAKIRSAVLHGKMAEAAGLTVEALREKIGFGPASPASEPAPEALEWTEEHKLVEAAPKAAKSK